MTLLLDHIKHQETIESASAQESPESIFQFLATHAFEGLVREVQEVLLKTSILPDVSVTLAVGLTNSPKAGEVLRSLPGSPLHRKAGRARAVVSVPPAVSSLPARAARDKIFSGRGSGSSTAGRDPIGGKSVTMKRGIAQLRQAEDWTAMAARSSPWPRGAGTGRPATVDDWIAAIPQHAFAGTPGYVSGMPVRDCLGILVMRTSCSNRCSRNLLRKTIRRGPADRRMLCAVSFSVERAANGWMRGSRGFVRFIPKAPVS